MGDIKTFRVNNQVDIKNTNVYSGDFKLIESNSILYYDSSLPIELEIKFTSYLKITIRFINEKNDSGEHDLKINVDTEANVIEYRCINFDNSFGTGTTKPIKIGTIGGKNIFTHFWIYKLGNNKVSRKIEYSIWQEK